MENHSENIHPNCDLGAACLHLQTHLHTYMLTHKHSFDLKRTHILLHLVSSYWDSNNPATQRCLGPSGLYSYIPLGRRTQGWIYSDTVSHWRTTGSYGRLFDGFLQGQSGTHFQPGSVMAKTSPSPPGAEPYVEHSGLNPNLKKMFHVVICIFKQDMKWSISGY